MKTIPNTAALVIIDVQAAFDDQAYWGGNRNNPALEANIRRLLDCWRAKGMPLYHVRHDSVSPGSPLRPGTPGNKIKDEVAPLPGETVITKNVNSAFIGTHLEALLRENGTGTLVIAGIQTDHCVSTTARMAGNLGFDTYVVADGCATFDRRTQDGTVLGSALIHEVSLVSLDKEFATVCHTRDILSALNAH